MRSVLRFGLLVAAMAVMLLVASGCGGNDTYTIASGTMEPTLNCAKPGYGCKAEVADKVVVTPADVYKRGDIVLFEMPPRGVKRCGTGGKHVSRVIGIAGDVVETRERNFGEGYVLVNGKEPDEPYVDFLGRRGTVPYGPFTVPEGNYFLMGDHRGAACDSRVWGALPAENMVGTVTEIIHP